MFLPSFPEPCASLVMLKIFLGDKRYTPDAIFNFIEKKAWQGFALYLKRRQRKIMYPRHKAPVTEPLPSFFRQKRLYVEQLESI